MTPSPNWFPTSLQDRAAWYLNFNTQAQATGATLGLTAGDLTQIDNDNDVMQFLAATKTQLDAYEAAVTTYRRIITTGDVGDVTPPFPANPAFALPVVIPTGMFERLSEVYRQRIMASAAYTDEQGVLYGIVGIKEVPKAPSSIKPTLEVFAAQTGYMFSAVVSNREDSDMWDISVKMSSSANWTLAKTATGKATDVVVTPTTPGQPIQLQARVQLKKNNQNYGQLSDTVYVTVNP